MNFKFAMAALSVLLGVGAAGAAETSEVKIRARGAWPHLPTHASGGIGTDRAPLTRVIRSEVELAKAAGGGARITAAKEFKVAEIDFAKRMIVSVEDGTQPMVGISGGGAPSALYAVAIVRIDRDDDAKTMVVRWRRVPRGKDQAILTRPLEAVLVDKFDGEVTFDRLPPSDSPEKEKEPPVAGKEVAPAGRAFWPDGWPPEAPRREWSIRDEAELIDARLRAPEPVLERMRADAKARYVKALKVEDIDFAKRMVVGVSAGVQPAGSRVEVTRVEVDAEGKTMTVIWKLRPPERGKAAKEIAHPAEIVLLDRFAGTIRFRQDVAKGE
jgi:hypothetical protein